MAEELPQNSSGSQVASKDSGVIDGVQPSNSTGKSATVQNNQSNKKYDLGVLFVHGIGKQKPGDTFETMFWPIKNKLEEILAQNLPNSSTRIIKGYYKATKRNCLKTNTSLVGLDVELQNLDNYKNIAFRESHWHEKNINNQDMSFCEIIKEVIDIAQAALRIFLLKILQPRVSTIVFILFVGFMYVSFRASYFRDFMGENEVNWAVVGGILCFLGVILICLLVIKLPDIGSLVGQVQSSRLGHLSKYVNTVSSDIRSLINESTDILIVSHSMGGYLAHKAVSQMSGFNGKIYFVGMGSGLGPMSIIEKPTNCGRGNSCPGFIRRFKIDILVYLTLFSLLSIELVTLWFNLSLFFSGRWDNGFIFITRGLSGTPILMCIFINIAIILLVYLVVYTFLNSGFKLGYLGEETHYEFYYPADLVGNTSRFVYSRDINDARVGGILGLSVVDNIFKRVIFAHDMGYYMKNNTIIDSSSCLVGLGARIQNFSLRDIEKNLNKNRRKNQLLWIWLIFLGIYGFQVLMDTYEEHDASLPFYAVIYTGPMFVFLEYVSYFILGFAVKTLIHLYCLKVDLNSRLYRAISFFTVDVSTIILMAPLLFINIYGRPGFLSKLALIMGVMVVLILIAKLIKFIKSFMR